LKLQTALITGASSGIGKALVRKFANNGYDVVVVARQGNLLEEFAQELSLYHDISVTVIAKDLTHEAAPQEIYDELKARKIVVDVLVNDAGVGQRGAFHETDLAKSINIIRLNVEALTRMTQLFLADMVARNSGKILNVGSVAGFEPGPLSAVYHASKAYVFSFSEAIAEEIKHTNVQITVVCPGPTDTDFFRKGNMGELKPLGKGAVMEAQEVANLGYEGFVNGELVVLPGLSNMHASKAHRHVPASVQAKVNRTYFEAAKSEASQ
jgi:short-subunit dehydrogenase